MAITAEMWFRARSRTLTRLAWEAEFAAARTRERVELFPDHADELERIAAGLDEYVARCRAAAADRGTDAGVRRQQTGQGGLRHDGYASQA